MLLGTEYYYSSSYGINTEVPLPPLCPHHSNQVTPQPFAVQLYSLHPFPMMMMMMKLMTEMVTGHLTFVSTSC